MIVLPLFVTAALLGMAAIMLSNLTLFPRLNHLPPRLDRWLLRRDAQNTPDAGRPRVSVLIPARNEAGVIRRSIERLLAQHGVDFELIVLDDHSTDGTGDLARTAAHGDSRLRVIRGADLPRGWAGKNWACYQLAQAACGELLVFTDADTIWQPGGLAAVAAEQARTDADLLTVWPTQITETWAERLVVPLMSLVVLGYLPVFLTHLAPWAAFAAANGQCLAFRRSAYDAIGGHAALRGEVLEDVKFARRVKAMGLRLRMADGDGLIACRMYDGWPAVRDGYAKNILAGYGGSLPILGLATVFHWLLFLYPPAWLVWGARGCAPGERMSLRYQTDARIASRRAQGASVYRSISVASRPRLTMHRRAWPWWPLGLVALGIALRAITAVFTHQRARDALLMPVSALLMTAISVRSVWWQVRYGGPVWKGRVVKMAPEASA